MPTPLRRPEIFCYQCLAPVTELHYRGGASQPVRLEGWRRLRAWVNGTLSDPTPEDYRVFDALALEPLCQNNHPLPPDPLHRRTLAFGLVGPRRSSKSHFLCSLIEQVMSTGPLIEHGWGVRLTSESADRFQQVYRDPLYRHGIAIDATEVLTPDQTRPPLILELTPIGVHDPRPPVNIVFFDAAGEQLAQVSDHANFSQFLYLTDALLFTVPPESLGELQQRVPESAREVPEMDAYRLQTMVYNACTTVAKGREGRKLPQVVTQVLLTKADLLSRTGALPADYVRQTITATTPLDEVISLVEERSPVVQKMVAGHGGRNLAIEFPAGTYWHAVSATGSSFDPEREKFPEVKPFGCLEPFLIALWRLGVLVPAPPEPPEQPERPEDPGDYGQYQEQWQ